MSQTPEDLVLKALDQASVSVGDMIKALTEAHLALAPISRTSTMYDVRQIAKILMRLIEQLRGGEVETELQPRHHP